jgi:hypothetical protein
MPMFRKKPVVIEAVQYGPYTAPTIELCLFLDGSNAQTSADGIVIPTLEGDHLARAGDWIIKGVKGEFYPCKPDIFAATYEPADTPSAPSPEAVARAALEWAADEAKGIADQYVGYMSGVERALRALASDPATIAAIITKAGGGE